MSPSDFSLSDTSWRCQSLFLHFNTNDMSKRESIGRYNLIINKLRKVPASFKEIADYLERESEIHSYNYTISLRTFQRDIAEIGSLFDFDIQYDRSRKVYFINDDGQPEVKGRMLEAFDTFHALKVSEGLANFIHFEKRKPQGTENLYGLIHCIKNNYQIKFNHFKFWEENVTLRTADPYALREFKNRWYVLAKDHKDDKIKSFALDRMSNLEITNKKFTPSTSYDVSEHYRYCFGIISPNGEEPQNIILSFDVTQGKYIKTLPLHESQEILLDNNDELQIKLKLCVSHDLIMELLSYGNSVKVLQPESLAATIKTAHFNAFNQYGH